MKFSFFLIPWSQSFLKKAFKMFCQTSVSWMQLADENCFDMKFD